MNNFFQAASTFIVACIAFAAFFGLPIMWIWNNCLVGSIDGLHEISFLKALGLVIFVELLKYDPQQSNKE